MSVWDSIVGFKATWSLGTRHWPISFPKPDLQMER